MGSGDFGSNGSVHWNIRHTGPGGGKFNANDPIPYDEIGNGGGHKDTFRLTIRFKDEATAKKRLNDALAGVTPQGVVRLLVDKVTPQRPQPGQPEIEVDW